MAINKDNRGGNGRRISNKINRGDLTPKEQLNIKRKLRKKEKRSTIIKRAILALILTVLILVTLSGIYLFSFISLCYNNYIKYGKLY